MRADRLVSLVLLLQARGRMTALALAGELEVSVRTIYRDLEALSSAGVPVRAESGPGGGCQIMDGYRFPLRGLRPDEAEALLILGVPSVLRDLGLESAVTAAHRQIRVTAGLDPPRERGGGLVHLDMPRWFGSEEDVPHLGTLAQALRRQRCLELEYRRGSGGADAGEAGAGGSGAGGTCRADAGPGRVVRPLGLVNKAGTWYLVAAAADGAGRVSVFRAGRITRARVRAEGFERPAGFELAAFWAQWSAAFMTTRPRLAVQVRASPEALALLPEVFGDAAAAALAAAGPPDDQGWQVVPLSFEHEHAAAHRLAGFGAMVEVLAPVQVRDHLVATARALLARYHEP
ncbi:MAG TPA: YafY family protein [Streptosporangiaceae bacterium]|nr:YafY family protein [Streptosporangiaceae bacterium]